MPARKDRKGVTSVLTLLAVASLSAALLAAQDDDRFRTEDVAFTAACDGTTQRYVRMLPQGFRAEGKHHVLVALQLLMSTVNGFQIDRFPLNLCQFSRN